MSFAQVYVDHVTDITSSGTQTSSVSPSVGSQTFTGPTSRTGSQAITLTTEPPSTQFGSFSIKGMAHPDYYSSIGGVESHTTGGITDRRNEYDTPYRRYDRRNKHGKKAGDNTFNTDDPAVQRQLQTFIRGRSGFTGAYRKTDAAFITRQGIAQAQSEAKEKAESAASFVESEKALTTELVVPQIEEIRLGRETEETRRQVKDTTAKKFRKSVNDRAKAFGQTLDKKELTKWIKEHIPTFRDLGPEELEILRVQAVRDLLVDQAEFDDISEIR